MYQHIDLETPLRANMTDTRDPVFVKSLIKVRRLIETVIGQLPDHLHIAKVRARDLWHLTSRINRKILAHTMGRNEMDPPLCGSTSMSHNDFGVR